MSEWFDNCFLHDGHIGGCSSSFGALCFGSGVAFPSCVPGVDSTDFAGRAVELVSKVHLTGMKFFRLSTKSPRVNPVHIDFKGRMHVRKGMRGVPAMARRLELDIR